MIGLAAMSFIAGNVAILSPCVLPAVPFVVSSAFQEHKLGPAVLSSGMLTSFVTVAVTLEAFGSVLGIDNDSLKTSSSFLLILMGLFFLSEKLQSLTQVRLGNISNKANNLLNNSRRRGLFGQFVIGALIGVVWSPCIGPTLGSALGLAAQADTRASGFFLVLVYALGIIIPFLTIAYSARYISINHFKFFSPGKTSKRLMGILMIGFGISTLTGFDKFLESRIFEMIPESTLAWLTSF